MYNIWHVILQGLSVTCVALIILAMKRIFIDKLSPHWQYGVWLVFALRVFIPMNPEDNGIFPFGVCVEILKNVCEENLSSVFSSPYSTLEFKSVFPVVTSSPESVTDIIFTVYFIGVILFMLIYILLYIKLRLALRKGEEAKGEELLKAEEVFRTRRFKPSKILFVKGISSAFVCGVFRPILVLPKDKETDEKILLHEAEHLSHLDSLQSMFWCFVRCLNWYNPIVHFAVNKILSDMESLCDQRVLENLSGEERRAYGKLLLNEVNNKYASIIGTTSLSNGGRNIAKRIEAIVRFKLYPRGMALVSVIIIFNLAFLCLFFPNVEAVDLKENYRATAYSERYRALAMARINKCKTPAAAIETWAKGKANENGFVLLTVTPKEKEQFVIAETGKNFGIERLALLFSLKDSFTPYNIYNNAQKVAPYQIFNVKEVEKNKYKAIVGFSVEGEMDEYGHISANSVYIPIIVYEEDRHYVVEEKGERFFSNEPLKSNFYEQILETDFSKFFSRELKGKNGDLIVSESNMFSLENPLNETNKTVSYPVTLVENTYDEKIYYKKDFDKCYSELEFTYICDVEKVKGFSNICINYSFDPNYEFPQKFEGAMDGLSGSSSTNDGSGYTYKKNTDPNFSASIEAASINSNGSPESYIKPEKRIVLVAVYVDREKIDEFTVEVE